MIKIYWDVFVVKLFLVMKETVNFTRDIDLSSYFLRYVHIAMWAYAANMTWMVTIPDSQRESLRILNMT